jgi:hypothetical protein
MADVRKDWYRPPSTVPLNALTLRQRKMDESSCHPRRGTGSKRAD